MGTTLRKILIYSLYLIHFFSYAENKNPCTLNITEVLPNCGGQGGIIKGNVSPANEYTVTLESGGSIVDSISGVAEQFTFGPTISGNPLVGGNYTINAAGDSHCSAGAIVENIAALTFSTPFIQQVSGPCVCDGAITVEVAQGSGYTYTLSGSHGVIKSEFSTGAVTFTGLCPDTYTITAQNGPCSGTTTITLPTFSGGQPGSTNSAFTAGVTPHNPHICQGQTIQLSANIVAGVATPAGYSWTGPGGFTSTAQAIIVGTPGTYTVTITSTNGCTASAGSLVSLNALSVAITPSSACAGNTLSAQVTGGVAPISYQWYFNGSTALGTGSTQLATNPGAYSVEVIDGSPCISNSTSVTVYPSPTVTVTAPVTQFCPGGSVTLTAQTNAQNPSFVWSNGSTANPLIVTQGGSYSVTVTNGSTGCSTTSGSVTITENSNPSITIVPSATQFCPGGSVTLTAQTNAQNPSFVWSNGSTANSITVTQGGSYSVTVTDGSTGCSTTSGSVTVTANPNPSITIVPSATQFCPGGSVTLTAQTNANNPSFVWSNGSTANPLTVTQGGSYSVTVTDGSTGCSTTSGSVTITANPNPSITIIPSATQFCPGGSVTLTAQTNANNPSFVWSNGSTASSITVTQGGSYSVTVTDGSTGCSTTSGSVTITANPSPSITLVPSATQFCQGDSVTLTAQTNASNPSFVWSNGSTANPLIVTQGGSYAVTVTDGITGCSATSGRVTISEIGCDPKLSLVQCCPRKIFDENSHRLSIKVTNSGPSSAVGIVVTEELPCCLDLAKLPSDPKWVLVQAGKTLQAWYQGELAAGQIACLNLWVRSNNCCFSKKKAALRTTVTCGQYCTPITEVCCIEVR